MKNQNFINKENQESHELSDFLVFAQKMLDEGIISKEKYDSIYTSNQSSVLRSYLSLFFEIEIGFWPVILPAIFYTSRDDFSQSPSSLMLEYILFSISATTLRGSLAYWRGGAHGLSHPSSFALVEIVPKIGRLAPILWLPEHREYLVMLLIYKKYKNKNLLSESISIDIEKYQSNINRLQKIKNAIDSTIDRVKNVF